jgi:hypothetical protein
MAEVVCLPLDGNLLRTARDHAPACDAGRPPDDDDHMLCLVMRDDLRDWLDEHTGHCKLRWSEQGVEFVFGHQSEADDFCRFLERLGCAGGRSSKQPRSGRQGSGTAAPTPSRGPEIGHRPVMDRFWRLAYRLGFRAARMR